MLDVTISAESKEGWREVEMKGRLRYAIRLSLVQERGRALPKLQSRGREANITEPRVYLAVRFQANSPKRRRVSLGGFLAPKAG